MFTIIHKITRICSSTEFPLSCYLHNNLQKFRATKRLKNFYFLNGRTRVPSELMLEGEIKTKQLTDPTNSNTGRYATNHSQTSQNFKKLNAKNFEASTAKMFEPPSKFCFQIVLTFNAFMPKEVCIL